MRVDFSQAKEALKSGKVIAVPTETVYGLAACLDCPHAIEQIFALKGRPHANPLIIHVADREQINDYAVDFFPGFESLAEAFWPGPLTIIVPVNSKVPSIVRAGLPTAGFRVPALSITRSLIAATGPLVMPSANLSGSPSSTCPEHVEEDFGRDFPILDGGTCSKGVESTIVLFRQGKWVIVRLGAIAPEHFEPVLGYTPEVVNESENDKPLCPGQLFRHYAPKATLILGKPLDVDEAAAIIGFKERSYPPGKRVVLLGSLSTPEEAAENLYKVLRQLDHEGIPAAWVDMDFPREGLWQTIAERLMRAGEN